MNTWKVSPTGKRLRRHFTKDVAVNLADYEGMTAKQANEQAKIMHGNDDARLLSLFEGYQRNLCRHGEFRVQNEQAIPFHQHLQRAGIAHVQNYGARNVTFKLA